MILVLLKQEDSIRLYRVPFETLDEIPREKSSPEVIMEVVVDSCDFEAEEVDEDTDGALLDMTGNYSVNEFWEAVDEQFWGTP